MRRVIVHFKRQSEKPLERQSLRLYIRDGIVLNPAVETKVKEAEGAFELVAIRKTGEGFRDLTWKPADVQA